MIVRETKSFRFKNGVLNVRSDDSLTFDFELEEYGNDMTLVVTLRNVRHPVAVLEWRGSSKPIVSTSEDEVRDYLDKHHPDLPEDAHEEVRKAIRTLNEMLEYVSRNG